MHDHLELAETTVDTGNPDDSHYTRRLVLLHNPHALVIRDQRQDVAAQPVPLVRNGPKGVKKIASGKVLAKPPIGRVSGRPAPPTWLRGPKNPRSAAKSEQTALNSTH